MTFATLTPPSASALELRQCCHFLHSLCSQSYVKCKLLDKIRIQLAQKYTGNSKNAFDTSGLSFEGFFFYIFQQLYHTTDVNNYFSITNAKQHYLVYNWYQ